VTPPEKKKLIVVNLQGTTQDLSWRTPIMENRKRFYQDTNL